MAAPCCTVNDHNMKEDNLWRKANLSLSWQKTGWVASWTNGARLLPPATSFYFLIHSFGDFLWRRYDKLSSKIYLILFALWKKLNRYNKEGGRVFLLVTKICTTGEDFTGIDWCKLTYRWVAAVLVKGEDDVVGRGVGWGRTLPNTSKFLLPSNDHNI